MIVQWCLIAACGLAAIIHGAAFTRGRWPAWATPSRLLALAALLILCAARQGPLLLTLAFSLGLLGELLLARRPRPRPVVALASSILAQLCLTGLFLMAGGGRSALMAEPLRDLGVGAVFAVIFTTAVWLGDDHSSSRGVIAITIESAALILMTTVALTLPRYFWPAMVGALAVAAAIGLAATADLKTLRGPWVSAGAWWLYIGGQALIAYGLLR